MDKKSFLENMDLPLANHNEDLETISELKLRPLFDTTLFHFCTQDRRDKGVDITYEIKKSGKHTGFRLVLQLKSSERISPNNDRSYSLSVDTSNINYLLNQSVPAFYILYVVENNKFYYYSVSDLLQLLQKKDNDWAKQKSHTVRFEKELDMTAFTLLYDASLKFGLMQRTLKERSAFIASSINVQERISIDSEANITDDAKIRRQIENVGIALINEGRWREVLEFHKSATGHMSRSALYNMTLGMAHYYGGSRLDALSFFKSALKDKSDLNEEMQKYLQYFDATVRFSIGLMAEDQYNATIKSLEESQSLGLYILLQNAKQEYMQSFETQSGENFELYKSQIEQLINHTDAHENFILAAKCDLALFEGYNNNSDYLKDVAETNTLDEIIGPDVNARVLFARKFISKNQAWAKSVEDIISQARSSSNSFIYFTALLNYVKVSYQFNVFTRYFYVVKEIPGYPRPEKEDNAEKLELMQQRVGLAANFFSQIGHVENTVAASCAFYELLHYVGKFDRCEKLLVELEAMVDNYELTEEKRKLEILKNGGTTHEMFKNWVDNAQNKITEIENEHTQLKSQMIAMDEQEASVNNKQSSNTYQIQLFPIGHFQFPSDKVSIVYQIIGATAEAINQFDIAFTRFIPIANIYRYPVKEEGYVNGMLDDAGIESFRNIFRIRKAFYENGFYRIQIRH